MRTFRHFPIMFFDVMLAKVLEVSGAVATNATEERLFQVSLEVQLQVVLPRTSVVTLLTLKHKSFSDDVQIPFLADKKWTDIQ